MEPPLSYFSKSNHLKNGTESNGSKKEEKRTEKGGNTSVNQTISLYLELQKHFVQDTTTV